MTRRTRGKDSHIIEEARRADRWHTFPEIADLLDRNVHQLLVFDFLDIVLVLDGSVVFTNFFNNPVEPIERFITFDDNTIVFKTNFIDIVDNNFLRTPSFAVADDVADDIVFHDLARANIPIQRIILDDTFPIGCRAALHEEPHLLLDLS